VTVGEARRVVLLSVGDELLSGDIVDTNSRWLANLCAERGHRVVAMVTVGDQVDEIERALRRSREDADLVLVTGGLGPTDDDLTREGVAAAFGLALEQRPELIDALAVRIKRPLTPGSRRQAEMPPGALVLDNPRGTAPGFYLEDDGLSIAVMPGVPAEMELMAQALFDDVIAAGPLQPPRRIQLAGLPESQAAQLLGELMDPSVAGCRMGITVKLGQTTVTVRGEDAAAMDAAADAAALRLADAVFSRRNESLAEWCVAALAQRGLVVSCAESCTGGLLSGALTAVPGSSAVFRESMVSYADAVKVERLSVPPELVLQWGVVSEQVAAAMAEGQRAASGADVALSITGIAGPDGGTPDKPVGTVHYALSDEQGTVVRQVCWPGSRADIRGRAVNLSLDLLRRRLSGLT